MEYYCTQLKRGKEWETRMLICLIKKSDNILKGLSNRDMKPKGRLSSPIAPRGGFQRMVSELTHTHAHTDMHPVAICPLNLLWQEPGQRRTYMGLAPTALLKEWGVCRTCKAELYIPQWMWKKRNWQYFYPGKTEAKEITQDAQCHPDQSPENLLG